jgi:hypothetical protein
LSCCARCAALRCAPPDLGAPADWHGSTTPAVLTHTARAMRGCHRNHSCIVYSAAQVDFCVLLGRSPNLFIPFGVLSYHNHFFACAQSIQSHISAMWEEERQASCNRMGVRVRALRQLKGSSECWTASLHKLRWCLCSGRGAASWASSSRPGTSSGRHPPLGTHWTRCWGGSLSDGWLAGWTACWLGLVGCDALCPLTQWLVGKSEISH